MQGVIEAHREAFQPLISINYEAIAAELKPFVTADVKLPESKFSHIYRSSQSQSLLLDDKSQDLAKQPSQGSFK